VAQVQQVECQPSKHEDLSSNPSTTKGRKKKKKEEAGRQWLTPVILAIQEAEIRRITV
jgi:hypothetical protein